MADQTLLSARNVEAANGGVKRLPQAIGHRGYSAKYAENTVSAMIAALEHGADGIETDVHMSADGVVVISHDPTAKRVFGSDARPLSQRSYAGDLDSLRTTRAPFEKMPLLVDLLELFVSNKLFENKWVVIDVKADNDVGIIEGIANAMAQVKDEIQFWKRKIVLGVWFVKFLPACEQFLPEISIVHIGVDTRYARKFLSAKNVVGFSLLLASLYSRDGYAFIREVRQTDKAIYAWTVNTAEAMRMCMALQVDGVLTDDPVRFVELRQDKADGKESEGHYSVDVDPESAAENVISLGTKTKMYALGLLVRVASPILRSRYE